VHGLEATGPQLPPFGRAPRTSDPLHRATVGAGSGGVVQTTYGRLP
jgi:hypothetical protein